MKKILSLILSLSVGFLSFIGVTALPVRAQQVASLGKSISELKEQYERLLLIERNPATPAEIREMNHRFLEERRTQLRAAIEKRLGALRNYHSSVGATLSAEETLVVENSIKALEKDLASLQDEQKKKSAAAPATKTPAPRARLVGARATKPEPPAAANGLFAGNAQPVALSAVVKPPARQDPPKIVVESGEDKVTEPKAKVTVKLVDSTNKLGKNVKVTITSGENKKVANATIDRLGEDGRLIDAPSVEVEVDLFKGENSIIAIGTTPDGTAVE
nr:hypothetical protein [Acidobacteriota bacterium]